MTNDLLSILDLEPLEHNLFRGRSYDPGWQRVFGGQVIGQALMAASRTVDERLVHSLHGYFLRPGDPKAPIIYDVERIRDGGSFTTRRVVAIQHGQPIFSMAASFHLVEDGFEHQIAMPDVAAPETLPDEAYLVAEILKTAPASARAFWARKRPIEIRPVDPEAFINRAHPSPRQAIWIRAREALGDDPVLHRCVLAYASDLTLLDATLLAHGRWVFDGSLQVASLDHAMWFHRPFRMDDWLLYVEDSPSAQGARGFNRGSLFDRAGRLIASTAQEGLVRPVAR
ncbi:acyl-CoA thioesterase-2 [Kaistia dalseonensis]|uniref:Acyl-CoA thioesterase-2 n=1 Tax=Kaistia dalseonensis TaxID=410840 RepID=A0ABU0H764_9HYPH|nr:acyl-CoA thioesterase II [Kaistia dalseonensis]MDQ0437306.1 acyl-CoA thioesterase-2 [Kaistia dalseonensis]